MLRLILMDCQELEILHQQSQLKLTLLMELSVRHRVQLREHFGQEEFQRFSFSSAPDASGRAFYLPCSLQRHRSARLAELSGLL